MDRILIYFTLLVSIAVAQAPNNYFSINLCEVKDFNDDCIRLWMQDGKCFNLSTVHWQWRAKAINTHGRCLHLFTDDGCTGEKLVVSPGTPYHNDLERLQFHEKTSSLITCLDSME